MHIHLFESLTTNTQHSPLRAVESRCDQMLALAREMQEKLQIILKTNLIRVPKKLKKMTLNDFVAEFGALPLVTCATAVSDENAGAGIPHTAVKGAAGEYTFSK